MTRNRIIQKSISSSIASACAKIAPSWPLENSIAVNPYLGLSDQPFPKAAQILMNRSGIKMTMSLDFYLDQIERNITGADIRKALDVNDKKNQPHDEFLAHVKYLALTGSEEDQTRGRTVVDLAGELTNKDWQRFMIDRISAWASTYFDRVKREQKTTDLFNAWKKEASIDRSPDVMGLRNFRSTIKKLSDLAPEASKQCIKILGISEDGLEAYLHTLMLKVIGWSSYVAGKDWNARLYGGNTSNLESFLAILLCWEVALLENFKKLEITSNWQVLKEDIWSLENVSDNNNDERLEAQVILQDAFDFAGQRELAEKFDNPLLLNGSDKKRPKAQAVFCIDVRSEVYRRNLEAVDPEIETLGFAGFFGFPIKYHPLGFEEGKNQCPALIPSQAVVKEAFLSDKGTEKLHKAKVIRHQVEKTWKQFKSGKVSAFAFVSPLGLSYLPKLISDSFGWTKPAPDPNTDGLTKTLQSNRQLDLSAISLEEKVTMAQSAIKAMGLSNRMAPIVLLVGHGSSSVNNPFATGLDCGACGGHSGEINALTAAEILNDPQVRKKLGGIGVNIPEDTFFIACLHDTTTDNIKIVNEMRLPRPVERVLKPIRTSLAKASTFTTLERAKRFGIQPGNAQSEILRKSNDWSQVRPEWGLAGCNAFIIAPRGRTKGRDFGGKTFLHSYNWQEDQGFGVLESIMTAPMVVTTWINLQYYASTTDNERLGAGNKTLHNVTAGIGVLEGAGGDLRIGLPWQSIHDGEKYQHLPQRLNVIIEAPLKAINGIIEKHPMLQDLLDNRWISLLAMDGAGRLKHRYTYQYNWETIKSLKEVNKKDELITI